MIKNIVIVILICEFVKYMLVTEKFKKYVNLAVSLFVIGFIFSSVRGTDFNIDTGYYDFNNTNSMEFENLIIKEYKNKIIEKIKSHIDGISSIDISVDEKYNVTNIKIVTKNIEKTEKILEELGFEKYEVINE